MSSAYMKYDGNVFSRDCVTDWDYNYGQLLQNMFARLDVDIQEPSQPNENISF